MGSEHYCLRWNNHQNNLLGVFSQLLQDESLVDVTLACAEGHSIRAHKVVLSACSSYFQSLFVDHPGRHPIVILKDVCFSELRTLVEFMYRGEVNVEYCRLSALLKTAESLKVKGLAEMTHLRGAGGAPPRQDDSEPPRAPEQPPGTTSPRPDTPPPPTTQPPATPPDAARPCDDLDTRSRTPDADDDLSSVHSGPSDMTISRLPSPHPTEPQPGPSGMPPVQQVPLSLKKEVDWDRAEEGDGQRSVTGESSSDYRHPHDPILNSAGMELWTSFKDGHNYTLKGHQGKEIDRLFHSLRPLENPPYGITDQYYAYYMEVCLVEGVYGPTCFPRHRGTPYDQIGSGRSTTPFTYPPFPPLPSCYPHSETLLSLLSQQGLLPPLPPTEGTLRCAVCLAGFPSAWLLEQHTALQHSGQAPRSHAPEPTEDKPFRCDQCGQSYRYRSAFLKHREQNHRARLPADKLFTCDVCGMQFRYLKSFKKHRLNHALERLHNPFHRPGSAASDSRRSERSEQSERSERSDRGDRSDTKSENSERSEGVSTSARSVNDEVTSTNEAEGSSNPPATSPCPPEQDDTVDSLALALGSNEASLLGLLRLGAEERQRERRSFACPFCGKCVRSKENLKLHVRKHTGERPFACLFCGRAFGGKSDLTRHLRIHTGERPYHCEMCGKCFARADYLSKHLTTHIHNSHHQR